MITRLGLAGVPRHPYGSLDKNGKEYQGPTTRLGLYGAGRPLYADFTGKRQAPTSSGQIVRLALCGVSRPIYSDFTGKRQTEIEVPSTGGGGLYGPVNRRDPYKSKETDDWLDKLDAAHREAVLRDDDELMVIMLTLAA